MRRLLIALGIAIGIYGLALGVGTTLYATGVIGTGATHNDCSGYKEEIADEQGIEPQDVEQSEIEERTEACLATHELTEEEAYRTEYVIWGIWPALICAAVFLVWPVWTRVLLHQEEAELADEASRLEMGT